MTDYQACVVRLPKEFLLKALYDFASANGWRVVWRGSSGRGGAGHARQAWRRDRLNNIMPSLGLERYDKVEMWVVAGLAFYLGFCLRVNF